MLYDFPEQSYKSNFVIIANLSERLECLVKNVQNAFDMIYEAIVLEEGIKKVLTFGDLKYDITNLSAKSIVPVQIKDSKEVFKAKFTFGSKKNKNIVVEYDYNTHDCQFKDLETDTVVKNSDIQVLVYY